MQRPFLTNDHRGPQSPDSVHRLHSSSHPLCRHLLWLVCGLLWLQNGYGQAPDPNDYLYPVEEVEGFYSASFGEMRPNHFHAGVDIKTDGVEGKPLVAAADGYISRIAVSPSGYGRALYVTLQNGTTAVYGHIARFRDDIEQYVRHERERLQRNRIDLWCTAVQFPVRRGELIAYSGNSGSSFGPHLHYEIRETATQRTLNTVRLGIIRPKDDIAPRLLRLHYYETDTVRGVPIHAARAVRDIVETTPNLYRLANAEPLEIGPNGHFVLEAVDRRNGVTNRFGLYRVTLLVDGDPIFEYRMDGFTFDQSRYCNAASCYPLQVRAQNEAIRLATIDGACDAFYPLVVERGHIGARPGTTHCIRIEAEDDCGNCSALEFTVCGRKAQSIACDSTAQICDRRRTTTLQAGEASLTLPAGALYESIFVRPERLDAQPIAERGPVRLSPRYRFLSCDVPLQQAATVRIRAYVPEALRPHTTLAVINRKGRLVPAGGTYSRGVLTARTTLTGDLLVVADTVAPTIRPLFNEGADLSQARTLRFRVSDDFSGITSCNLYIDGKWVACDRYPMQGTAVHTLSKELAPGRHVVRLELQDACGNQSVWKGSFSR